MDSVCFGMDGLACLVALAVFLFPIMLRVLIRVIFCMNMSSYSSALSPNHIFLDN